MEIVEETMRVTIPTTSISIEELDADWPPSPMAIPQIKRKLFANDKPFWGLWQGYHAAQVEEMGDERFMPFGGTKNIARWLSEQTIKPDLATSIWKGWMHDIVYSISGRWREDRRCTNNDGYYENTRFLEAACQWLRTQNRKELRAMKKVDKSRAEMLVDCGNALKSLAVVKAQTLELYKRTPDEWQNIDQLHRNFDAVAGDLSAIGSKYSKRLAQVNWDHRSRALRYKGKFDRAKRELVRLEAERQAERETMQKEREVFAHELMQMQTTIDELRHANGR